MDWREIHDSQAEGRFYWQGRPLFKTFKSLLKFHEPGLAPVEDESGWYHITAAGNALYPERYKRAFGYYCGFAAVVSDCGCFHIDTQGRPLYDDRYDWCGNYQENYCAVRSDDGYFHIDARGGRLYPDNYCYAGDFRDGIACVKCKDGFWRHINSHGGFINNASFLDIGVFHKNIATARDEDGWFHCNMKGIPLYRERYLYVEPFYNGFALVTRFDKTKCVIDEHGQIVLDV